MKFQSILGKLVKWIKLDNVRLKMWNNASRKLWIIEKAMMPIFWKVDNDAS
jgi:hypothetical protein